MVVCFRKLVNCLKPLHRISLEDFLEVLAVKQIRKVLLVNFLNWLYPVSCFLWVLLLKEARRPKDHKIEEVAEIANYKYVVAIIHIYIISSSDYLAMLSQFAKTLFSVLETL